MRIPIRYQTLSRLSTSLSLTAQGDEGSIWNTVPKLALVAGATTAISIFVSCSAAYGFSRLRFPGREVGLMGLMLTQIFPGVVMMVPLYIILDNLGLLELSRWACSCLLYDCNPILHLDAQRIFGYRSS